MDKETAVPIFLIACVVLIIFNWYRSIKKNEEIFWEFCGGKDKIKYGYNTGTYGIALNVNTRTVFLKSRKSLKSYPYSDIRSWETNSQTRVTGVNTQLTNQNVKSVNFFQVNVKDVNYPVWALIDVPAGRWTEILNQEINES